MFKCLLTIGLFFCYTASIAQASDFISVKKRNNRTIKTFFPGLNINFTSTGNRQVSGLITDIRHDSIFVKMWDIRVVPTSLGVTMLDTAGSYIIGLHYKDIAKVDVSDRMKLQQVILGPILIIGGGGYIALNLINGAYMKQPVTDSKNLGKLEIAAGAVGAGLLINYIRKHRGRYVIEYIRMNEVKKQLRGF